MARYEHFHDLPVWLTAKGLYQMALVMKDRRAVAAAGELLTRIDEAAFSCIRQLAAWTAQIESGPVQGERHLTGPVKRQRHTAAAADKFRLDFLRKLDPKHALYNSPEAKAARGE